MTSSTFQDKSAIEGFYKKLEVVSSNSGSLKRPSFKSIRGDIQKFDNGKWIIYTKSGIWYELKLKRR